MKINNYIDLGKKDVISGLFFALGSFGRIDGTTEYERSTEGKKTIFRYTGMGIRLISEFTEEPYGLVIRKDKLENISTEEIVIGSLLSRFRLPGNRYEIYTQYNGWQQESLGGWQNIVTEVSASTGGSRSCDGAAPMMAFHDTLTGMNTVFHLVANARWQMRAGKVPRADKESIVFECGFNEKGLRLRVEPGEVIELPTVIFYSSRSKSDLGAHLLHRWFNKNYPRRRLPVIFNTWMYTFDTLDIEDLLRQVDCAADMGFEIFEIDAGWFGSGNNWSDEVGDWVENTVSGPRGRMIEVAERVRERGMTFGLWFEPERAAKGSKALKLHPEYYIENEFLDYSNPEAVDYMLEVISGVIDRYGIGAIKLDANHTLSVDPSGSAFYRYAKGQERFIKALRERYPELYITGCAGGGYRAELGSAMLFDSFWLSDNQGPCEGIRIVKDTLKRLPTSVIERYNTEKYCEGFLMYPNKRSGRMINCNDATWEMLVGVDDSLSEEFVTGGVMGFSCNIADFPEEYRERWKRVIAEHKRDRDFYRTAEARILADSAEISVIEYSDEDLSECVIKLFTTVSHTKELLVFPTVRGDCCYSVGGECISGEDILRDGILIDGIKNGSARSLRLKRV